MCRCVGVCVCPDTAVCSVWCTRSQRCPVLTQGLISRVRQPLSTHSHCVTYQRMPPPHGPSSTVSLIQQPNPLLTQTHGSGTLETLPPPPPLHTPLLSHSTIHYSTLPPATQPAQGLECTSPDSTAASPNIPYNAQYLYAFTYLCLPPTCHTHFLAPPTCSAAPTYWSHPSGESPSYVHSQKLY